MTPQRPPFRQFWDLGYTRLVPIVPPGAPLSERSTLHKRLQAGKDARGKAVGVRGGDGKWFGLDWIRRQAATHVDLDEWAAMGAGVGIRTGEGLVALDIDSLDKEIASQAEELAAAMLGTAPVRYGRRPKRILPYRTVEPIPYHCVEFTGANGVVERIELLSDGRQFVADGIHPATGKPYEWPDGIKPLSDLPAITAKAVTAYFAHLAKVLPAASRSVSSTPTDRSKTDQTGLIGEEASLRKAVAALPNTTELFPEYLDYIRVGAAIKGATQDDPALGLELFLEWCDKWKHENDPEVAAADYSRIKAPYELGARWLYNKADRYGGGSFNAASTWFEPIPENDNPFALSKEAEEPPKRFTFTPLREAAETALSHSAKPLIKGLLDQGAMTILYGESNSGKTFVAMDIAFHVAAGIAWGGMKVIQAPIVYIAAEGGLGARKRAAAIRAKYGSVADTALFHFLLSPVDLLHVDADLQPLITAVADLGVRPGLIVIDTLSRALAGGDENTSTDMGALVKHFDALRSATSAHLLAVHHSGKDKARGARGHSLLRAATDTEIEIADRQISVTKQRDLDKAFASSFTLDVATLGMDEDGDLVTSCTVRLVPRQFVQTGIPTPREQDVLDAIEMLAALSTAAREGVSTVEIATYFQGKESGLNYETVRFHLKSLLTKCLIKSVGRGKWVKVWEENAPSQSILDNLSVGDWEELGGEIGGNVFD